MSGASESRTDEIRAWFDAMLAAYGPQHWWPADTPEEVVIGAILTQNTAWTNVERAITALAGADCLRLERVHAMELEALAALIRSAGTYRVKARRLKALAAWLHDSHGGYLAAALAGDLQDVRHELLAVPGVGSETADAILLYAGRRPTFVVDAYTRRIMRRHGLIDESASYDDIKRVFESALPADVALFNEYHALIVAVGKRHCRARAECTGCPLADWPHDGTL